MRILYTTDQMKQLMEEFRREHAEAQVGLSPTDHIEEIRLYAHQEKFCELFAKGAPKAWADLKALEPYAVEWFIWNMYSDLENVPGVPSSGEISAEVVADNVQRYSRALPILIDRWANHYRINVPWIRFAALMTVQAMGMLTGSRAMVVGDADDGPSTLLFNDFPMMSRTEDEVSVTYARAQMQTYSTVEVPIELEPLTWDTLSETRAQFQARAREAFEERLQDQLARSIGENGIVAEAKHLDVHAHHVHWTIQRYAAGRAIKSLSKEHGTSRAGIRKGIESVRTIIGLPELGETGV